MKIFWCDECISKSIFFSANTVTVKTFGTPLGLHLRWFLPSLSSQKEENYSSLENNSREAHSHYEPEPECLRRGL